MEKGIHLRLFLVLVLMSLLVPMISANAFSLLLNGTVVVERGTCNYGCSAVDPWTWRYFPDALDFEFFNGGFSTMSFNTSLAAPPVTVTSGTPLTVSPTFVSGSIVREQYYKWSSLLSCASTSSQPIVTVTMQTSEGTYTVYIGVECPAPMVQPGLIGAYYFRRFPAILELDVPLPYLEFAIDVELRDPEIYAPMLGYEEVPNNDTALEWLEWWNGTEVESLTGDTYVRYVYRIKNKNGRYYAVLPGPKDTPQGGYYVRANILRTSVNFLTIND